MISPTIGRVVWFHADGTSGEQPHVALIAFVQSDTVVNLAVFDADGVPYQRTSVFLWDGDAATPTPRSYAEWMPYQKGQAAKYDALSKSMTL